MNLSQKLLKNKALLAIISALLCIIIGVLVGYIVLVLIDAKGANEAITGVMRNFATRSKNNLRIKEFGNTLIKTVPLILCSLSVLFAYKVGLFNIGVAGQYVIGAGACLYLALGLQLPWYVCLIAAVVAGALLASISGVLKAFLNVNEVISCIMLNWVSLYIVNWIMTPFAPIGKKDTYELVMRSKQSILPSLSADIFKQQQDTLFNGAKVTIALPIAIIIAILIWILLEKTKFGFELRATGLNKNAAKYCGMREKSNIIVTMAIAGALGGAAAGLYFLSDFKQWNINEPAVPGMGFNGIAGAFLGGLNPIGSIFSSYFIQHITDGGTTLNTQSYPPQIADLISAIIIYLCSFVLFFKTIFMKLLNKINKLAAMIVLFVAGGLFTWAGVTATAGLVKYYADAGFKFTPAEIANAGHLAWTDKKFVAKYQFTTAGSVGRWILMIVLFAIAVGLLTVAIIDLVRFIKERKVPAEAKGGAEQ